MNAENQCDVTDVYRDTATVNANGLSWCVGPITSRGEFHKNTDQVGSDQGKVNGIHQQISMGCGSQHCIHESHALTYYMIIG